MKIFFFFVQSITSGYYFKIWINKSICIDKKINVAFVWQPIQIKQVKVEYQLWIIKCLKW